MKTNERVRRLSPGRARAVGLALFLAACGGTVGKVPSLGSESHFLAYCDSTCDAGLECIGGICTRSCLTDTSSCSDLGSGAQCTNQSVEPGQVAVCDVSCAQGSDCAALGTGYSCDGGYCRSKASAVVSTGDETPENAGGTGGADGGGSAGDSALCEAFRDQSPPPDVREISIVNTGSVALYIQRVRPNCDSPVDLVQVERDGQIVNFDPRVLRLEGVGRTCDRCEDVIENGWYEPRAACPDIDCRAPAPLRIEPGQTLQQPTRLEVVARGLPRACADGISTEAIDCYLRVIPQPGNYALTVRAALTLDCAASASDCDCLPDATGVCTNRSVSLETAPLVFSSPSPWYFQSHVLNIAAP